LTVSLINRLSAAAAAGAQVMTQFRLKLVGNQLTAQLNKKIAAFKEQSQDPMIPILQNQEKTLINRQKQYTAAQTQFSGNGSALADLGLQLGNLAAAASAGDAATFDATLAVANSDIEILQIAPPLAGLQPDGTAILKTAGLGIQSSASYNLSTPAGQAQATSDIQGAQSLVQQASSSTTLNLQITSSVSQALQGQISDLARQVSNKQTTEIGNAADQISKLKQQTQTEFHLVELAFGSVGQTAGVLTSVQNAANSLAPPPGSILSLLVGSSTGPTLGVANLSPIAPPTVGSKVSTQA
jgi:hypothetical protein